MANDEHVAILKKGMDAWNAWRAENYTVRPNLASADLANVKLGGMPFTQEELSGGYTKGAVHLNLSDADLDGTDLSGSDLTGADLRRANLFIAQLIGANFRGASFGQANLFGAELMGADLTGADLRSATLICADLTNADLRDADLQSATLEATTLTGADLTGCRVYGVSPWNVELKGAKQKNLIITHRYEPEITVDNIEVAQFIYLMLNNQKVRDVIDTITSKVVLILGRFTDERKAVLDALREELRERDYLPILFDFDVPARRNFTETITLLARMARFIIADLTDPSSIPQELQAIIPSVRVPVQPVLLEGSSLYSMFKDFDPRDFHWVLPVYKYKEPKQLLATLAENVIAPAEGKVKDLEERRRVVERELNKPQ